MELLEAQSTYLEIIRLGDLHLSLPSSGETSKFTKVKKKNWKVVIEFQQYRKGEELLQVVNKQKVSLSLTVKLITCRVDLTITAK